MDACPGILVPDIFLNEKAFLRRRDEAGYSMHVKSDAKE
jgi:hypothetical protein